jgi:hypothetical protein
VRKIVTSAVVPFALFAAAAFAPAAQAAPCDGIGAQQPFLDWHDSASYVLVDGGDFESDAAGWTLEGGAATAPGGNSLRPESSATALSLPAGASATSPAVCVSKGDPFARIFAEAPAAAKQQARIQVEVLYLNADGSVRKVKKAGKLRPQSSWQPTRRFSLAQGQFRSKKGHDDPATDEVEGSEHGQGNTEHGQSDAPHGQSDAPHGQSDAPHGDGSGTGSAPVKTGQIALRFTADGAAALIDDVFVDPRMRL